MNNWKKVTIGDIATFYNGKAHENCISESGAYELVNSRFVSTRGRTVKYSLEQRFPLIKGDIAMVMSDIPNGKALAKCYLVKEDHRFTLNQRICCFRTQKAVPEFLYYALNRNKFYLSFDSGVTQTNLRKEEVLECPIYLPPYEEQKTIADALLTWDTAIEKTEALIDAKERQFGWLQKSLIYKDFKSYDSHLSAYARIMKQQKIEKVGELKPLTVKLHCKGIEPNERDVQITLSKKGRPYFQRFIGEFLIGRQNFHNGGFGIVPEQLDGFIASNAITTLEINQAKLDPMYLFYFFSRKDYYLRIGHIMDGTGQKELSDKQIMKLPVSIPNLEEQKRIAHTLNTARHEITLLKKLAEQYRTQKRGLMQKLLSGQWHIKKKFSHEKE